MTIGYNVYIWLPITQDPSWISNWDKFTVSCESLQYKMRETNPRFDFYSVSRVCNHTSKHSKNTLP